MGSKVKDTDDGGSVWAFRYSSGNQWAGPISIASRSEKGAEDRLTKAAKERCRTEGHFSYRFAAFEDIQKDETLQAAWEHFGGGTQQSTFARKTSFKLIFFSQTLQAVLGSLDHVLDFRAAQGRAASTEDRSQA
jgi:hypothetical protein